MTFAKPIQNFARILFVSRWLDDLREKPIQIIHIFLFANNSELAFTTMLFFLLRTSKLVGRATPRRLIYPTNNTGEQHQCSAWT
jgi:hypothetical protein